MFFPILEFADNWLCVLSALQVETELKSICKDILDVLDKHLIPAANTGESKVFYYKMYVCGWDSF